MKIRVSNVFLSIVLAMMLSILPLPTWLNAFRPPWVFLALLYWMSSRNALFTLFTIWLIGILLDLLSVSLLGEHAVAMIICCYLGQNYLRRLKFFHLWQQSVLIALFVLLYQLIIVSIEFMTGYTVGLTKILGPTVSAMLFWPWIVFLLNEYGGRQKLQNH
jgi:rod shape-determining protein MreD